MGLVTFRVLLFFMAHGNGSTYTEQDRIDAVRDFFESPLSQTEFCKQRSMCKKTLKRWMDSYGHLAQLNDGYLPQGHAVKGTSVLYDAEGNIKSQWVKTDREKENNIKAILETVQALKEDIPRQLPASIPTNCDTELLSCYVVTDYHMGQLSWGEETGDDWDLDIAEEMLVSWFQSAIASTPKANTAILAQLGDFLHADSILPITPTSGHILDADTRYAKVVRVVIRVLRQIINMLLEKHENVHVLLAEGNHDLSSSIWLRALFAEKYADDPRVTVDETHSPYYAFEWGDTSLFFHHGHKKKMKQVSGVFAGQYREIYGRTKYSYAHTGHMHHVDVKEDQMMIVEQHPTLAAKDAHSSRGGYNSQRGANTITYHKRFGEVSRITIRPEMVK